jgi:methyl-accepting chemotaxis protein
VVALPALGVGLAFALGLTRSITAALRETIGTLASVSTEIVASTTQQAAGTAEEATAVQETSSTVEEVKQTAQLATQKSRAVAEAAQRASQVSQEGRRAVEENIKGMLETKGRMETIAERILRLSEQAQSIAEVIATVNDLAEQSNLLAVNAAIEAAKAGDSGRGFAVVASEVKALAEQSKQATAQVRGILNEIQRATQSAVMAAEQGVKASDAGVGLATRAGDAIRTLAESLGESAQAGMQILASAQQQAAGMDQIALAMRNIQQASTESMASTRQVERAAQDLNDLARRLKALVATGGNGSGVSSRGRGSGTSHTEGTVGE